MLTGTTIYNQAAKCKELMDILRRKDILDKLKKSEQNSGGGDDIIAQIEKLSKLKDSGILSEEEKEDRIIGEVIGFTRINQHRNR